MPHVHRRHFLGDEPAVGTVVDPALSDPGGVFAKVLTPDHFLKLGDLFVAKSEDKQACNRQIFRLTEVLQEEQKLPISRFFVSGPYGRRCSFGVIEVDVVVFLNESLPPFANALQRIAAKLEVFAQEEAQQQVSTSTRPIRVHPFKPRHDYVRLTIDRFYFRIFAAASLGWTPEEQRQAVYRILKKEYNSRGLARMASWTPALWERASQTIASESPETHAFILACKYWCYVHRITWLSPYAIEVLAFLVARQQRTTAMSELEDNSAQVEPTDGSPMVMAKSKTRALRGYRFDPLQAFQAFLAALEGPETLLGLSEVEAPASFVWPWGDGGQSATPTSASTVASPHDETRRPSCPVLVDTCNPYVNLVESVKREEWAKIRRLANVTLYRISGKSNSKWETTTRLTVADLMAPVEGAEERSRGRAAARALCVALTCAVTAGGVAIWMVGSDRLLATVTRWWL